MRKKKAKRRTKTMARRKRFGRTRTVARRVYSRGGGKAGFKPFIDGALAGVVAEAGQKFIGKWGAPVGIGAVGYFMHNSTLKTIAGLQLGSMVGDMMPVIGGGGSAINGAWL